MQPEVAVLQVLMVFLIASIHQRIVEHDKRFVDSNNEVGIVVPETGAPLVIGYYIDFVLEDVLECFADVFGIQREYDQAFCNNCELLCHRECSLVTDIEYYSSAAKVDVY